MGAVADPDGAMPGRLVMRRAAAPLDEVASSIGYLEGSFAHERELALPSGTMQLLVNLDRDQLCSYTPDGSTAQRTTGAAITGPYGRPALIDEADQRRIVWVAFRLGGAQPFLPVPAAATRDQLVDLSDLWGREAAALREELLAAPSPEEVLRRLEAFLLCRAHRPLRRDPAAVVATGALHHGATVSEVGDRLGWTPRRLGRLFRDHVGLPPKRFARVRRLQRVLSRAGSSGDVDWAAVAADCGYHDQSHLIHDFRDLTGITPSDYRPRTPDAHNHVPV